MESSWSGVHDESTQGLENWAKSWRRMQQEQLNEYKDRIHKIVDEQHVAMQHAMACTFETQMQQLKHVSKQRVSFDGETPDFHGDDSNKQRSPFDLPYGVEEQASETDLLSKNEDRSLERRRVSQDKLKDMAFELRRVIGWKPACENQALGLSHKENASFIQDKNYVQTFFIKLCRSSAFEVFTAFAVISNAVVIAIDADQALKHTIKTGRSRHIMPKFVDMVFLAIFSLELLCRLIALRRHFFHGRDRWWHAFDVLVVGMASVELFSETINLTSIRVLRVFRMMRVFRIIRLFRKLRALRLMVASIIVSFMTLIWAFVLLALVLFLFSIILIQGAAFYLEDQDVAPANVQQGLESHFSSLSDAMITLLASISGGLDWTDISEFLWDISGMYWSLYILFILFVLFGVLNVLTAVFVESSAKIANVDNELVILTEMESNESYINQIEQLFRELDSDNSGTLEWTEFQLTLADPRVQAYFSSLQIEVSEATSLFQLLDTNEDGSVLIEEFVLGCMRLKGIAKAVDIAMVMYETKKQTLEAKCDLAEVKDNLMTIGREVMANHAAIQRNMKQIQTITSNIHQHVQKYNHSKDHL